MCNKRLSLFIALIGMLMLSACVNLKPVPSQTKNYTLGPVSSISATPEVINKEPIYITRPQLPTYLDSAWLAYLLDDGELKRMATARWAEPLAEGIARAMSLYLAEIGVGGIEGYYPWPNSVVNSARLSLNFQHLVALESGEVQVVVRWALKHSDGSSKSGWYRSDRIVWVVGQPDALVAAYNSSLKGLALEIEASMSEP